MAQFSTNMRAEFLASSCAYMGTCTSIHTPRGGGEKRRKDGEREGETEILGAVCGS